MAIDTKEIYSAISRAQGEMTQAHFELVSIYLYEGQNSKYKDLDCNLILTYLIFKSLTLINEKNLQHNYNDLSNINQFDPINLKKSQIAIDLNYPRETVRRNLNKLAKYDFIKVDNKEIFVNMNECLSNINFERYKNSFNKIFLIILKNLKVDQKFDKPSINLEKKFSLIWYYFLDMLINISRVWKEYHKSLECWYIFGTCVLNQTYNSRDSGNLFSKEENTTENFILNITGTKSIRGLNPTTLSELTGIPRETVTRHLTKLLNNKTITKDKQNLFYFPSTRVKRKNLIKNIEFVKNNVSEFIFKVTKTMN
jgi:DNA-binding MarR family transcriptional regulator